MSANNLIGAADSVISYSRTLVPSFSAIALRERICGCSIRMIGQLLLMNDGADWLNMIASRTMKLVVSR